MQENQEHAVTLANLESVLQIVTNFLQGKETIKARKAFTDKLAEAETWLSIHMTGNEVKSSKHDTILQKQFVMDIGTQVPEIVASAWTYISIMNPYASTFEITISPDDTIKLSANRLFISKKKFRDIPAFVIIIQ